MLRLVLLLTSLLAVTAWSQVIETDADAAVTEQELTAAEELIEDDELTDVEELTDAEEPTEDEEIDDLDLDNESYADTEEDDFKPSEEISADQSIAFPTDI